MSHALTRLQTIRLSERKWLERAWSDQELADELGIVRQTVHRNRMLLMELEEDETIFIEVEHGRYKLDPKKYLPNLKLNRATATIAYTLAKRLARQLPEPDSHTLSLLKDLAFVLHQPLMDRLLRTTQVLSLAGERKDKTAVFEKIVDCWLNEYVVSIKYRSPQAKQPIIHRVHPYLIEPSPWNESLYLIGKSEKMGKITAFKLSRIEAAADTTQPVEYPEDFNEEELLQLAWGIWQGESAETVKLRFKYGMATHRLQETKWHPTEKVEPCSNGDLIWSAEIADWQEMLPWIRGWGADCEVLEPVTLRRSLEREVMQMAKTYQIQLHKPDANEDEGDYDDQWAAALFRKQ
ncbi:MAG: WYL domain-containing protein [Anaerolineales bacterium]|nr:WYL domain-containing protein [Anaerolineales bacterium]